MFHKKIAQHKHGLIIMLMSSLILILLIGAAFVYFIRDIRTSHDKLMVSQLAQLQKIFEKINNDCVIIDFDHQKNYIDFLNVKTFTGSQVGSMDLMHPDKWQGPYLETNFTIHEKLYLVVKTRKGYFIVPGEGVKLSNGKVVGKDIPLNYETDIEALAHNPRMLSFNDYPLAVKLPINTERLSISDEAKELSELDIA